MLGVHMEESGAACFVVDLRRSLGCPVVAIVTLTDPTKGATPSHLRAHLKAAVYASQFYCVVRRLSAAQRGGGRPGQPLQAGPSLLLLTGRLGHPVGRNTLGHVEPKHEYIEPHQRELDLKTIIKLIN